ncbi:MAG: hypothetical protein VB104_08005 [Candidatus Limiplasma sp.]|nr:hypothetical protein [Candidatus Limiplasma sp.]
MLYQVISRLIERGALEGLQEKLDVFFARDRLTAEEYAELTERVARG